MEIWYYAVNGVQQGPVSQAALVQLIASGRLPVDSLVWREGMTDWIPARSIPELAASDAAVGVVNSDPAAQPVIGYGVAPSAYSQPYALQYGGFWLRFAAAIIDSLVIAIPVFFVAFFIGIVIGISQPRGQGIHSSNPVSGCCVQIVIIVVQWNYFALMESSNTMATLGKLAVGLRVTNLAGQKISFGQASGRFFGKIISGLPTLCIGFMMAGWTQKKQALHDMMASTLVIKK